MFNLDANENKLTGSPLEASVEMINRYEEPENHIVLEDGVLYTSPAKDDRVTVEFAENEILDAQNMLDAIAASAVVGGTQYYWSRKRDSWSVIKDSLTA